MYAGAEIIFGKNMYNKSIVWIFYDPSGKIMTIEKIQLRRNMCGNQAKGGTMLCRSLILKTPDAGTVTNVCATER